MKKFKQSSRVFFNLTLLLSIFSIPVGAAAIVSPPVGENRTGDLRETWKAYAIERLMGMDADDCVEIIEPRVVELDDFYLMSFTLKQDGGCIFFPNGDWIYLISHSWHDEVRIGDLTLAIDNHKRIYFNDGHVCGGIINFYVGFETEVNSAQDFFQLFMSDCYDCKWHLLDSL